MRRITDKDGQGLIDYNLREDGKAVTIFADFQADRVRRTRNAIRAILDEDGVPSGYVFRIVEPGCSAGDISGPFAKDHDVLGIDVVPEAVRLTNERYPDMMVIQANAEEVHPIDCDILVLCEFLEHLDNPVDFVVRWLPKARYVVISHPLVGGGHDHEEGHSYAYDLTDFDGWFTMGGHTQFYRETFQMGYEMVLGLGKRLESL